MKKALKYLSIPILMFALLLIPHIGVRAEGTTPITIKSTSTNSIETSWPTEPTAQKYYLGIGTTLDEANQNCTVDSTAQTTIPSYTFTQLKPGNKYFIVLKYSKSDSPTTLLDDKYKNATAVTIPPTPTDVRATFWSLGTDQLIIEWNCEDKYTKFEVTVNDSDSDAYTKETTEKKMEFDTEDISYINIKVRSVVEYDGTKYYSAYSDSYKSFAQPTVKETNDGYAVTIKKKKLKIEWWREKYASGYEIWVSNKKNGKYTKVKTITNKNTEKATIAKYKGKKFNPKGKYWIAVTAYRDENGKRNRTSGSYVVYYDNGETYLTIRKNANLK
ncbi:hypothetical protein [Butyrivibrio sp. VCD2006]|uniref:hypothetical protein n=1 Tax=Butyrivibrio sp. VCD2006 TaxID=1280664 RepID=UPI00040C5C3E|nr:hypothetical protein [Butyrivibrio sp. VCD2006]